MMNAEDKESQDISSLSFELKCERTLEGRLTRLNIGHLFR